MRTVIRALPALFVTLLLAAALIAPGHRAGAGGPGTELDALSYPVCTPIQLAGDQGETGNVPISPGNGIVQPLGSLPNMASVILDVLPSPQAAKQLELVYWNPQTLMPDARTVQIRSRSFWATYMAINTSRFDFSPPLITRVLPGVAEPPPTETAVQYRLLSGSTWSETGRVSVEGPAGIPIGMGILGSQYLPMGGAHPVFVHSVCGGDENLQSHFVAQSVIKTDASAPRGNAQYIQKFRVPQTVSLRWVEYVLKSYAAIPPSSYYGTILIADAEGQSQPPQQYVTQVATANFTVSVNMPGWATHFDFTNQPQLQANHDYWLVMTTNGEYELGARQVTGTESPYFMNGIGPLFVRPTAASAAVSMPDRVLNFQIIGVPLANVGVEEEIRRPSSFALSVAPNPVRGSALVTWNGARGDLRFEVLDARGRRVSSGAAGIGETGRWTWSGTGDDGHALPAGVYFVRARDGVGRNASTRVSLVR